jgi:DNA recombination protein RmuC
MENPFVFLVIGLLAGFAIGYFLKLSKATNASIGDDVQKLTLDSQSLNVNNQNLQNLLNQTSQELEKIKVINNSLISEVGELKGRIETSRDVFVQQKAKLDEYERNNISLNNEVSTSRQQIKEMEKRIAETKLETQEMQKKFVSEFEVLANKILDEKTNKFTLHNKEQLGLLLNPFQDRIKEFEKKVDETYIKGAKESSALMEQVKQLADLNAQMRNDAQNLTNALKGDKKQQGNWGELILEKVLERSGLTNGQEYELQYSTTNHEGAKIQPDVVIKLPDNKHLIVDSKVSLNAYSDFTNETDDVLRDAHLKNHILNIKNHIKTLSEKNYHAGKGLNSPEFVLMFIPIESSFSTIIQNEADIWNYAWDRKIVLVSPSTLLATLRTIASVWKQERQNANFSEIARQAGAMYDKFVGFLEDMAEIEARISQTQKAYDSAVNKLSEGNGNLIRSADKIKELGARTEKKLPPKFIDQGE